VLGIALRKLVYRKLSFHEKIYKQVRKQPVYSEVAKDFTAWIKAIREATIAELCRFMK